MKRFLKRNLADVGDGSMNALADKVYTNKECHTVICTPYMATFLFNNHMHPYISSSGGTIFTATYVGMVVE